MLVLMAVVEIGHSQEINWRSLREDQRNIIQINVGYDYGVTAQVSYGRSFTILRPVVLGFDYSFPMGRNVLDDFKVRLGGRVEIVQVGGFSATIKILSNFRRYENALVRIVSFGSDFGLVTGYFCSTWYAAGEFGFDKSVVSHLRHSDVMRSNFPEIRNGWVIPTGGNYYYGFQGGKSLGENLDLALRLGFTRAQDHDEDAVIPYYAQLGLDVKF